MEYRLVPHGELADLAPQVYELTRWAFGSYPGVLVPSPAHRAWYVRRPGMDPDLSLAIVHEDTLVASLFVTVAAVRLGGRLQPVGIVDTVMTHPDHRRRGLARRLLTGAITGMRARGLWASLLYTLPGSMPYRFYQSLGYRAHAPVHYLRRLQPAIEPAGPEAQRAQPADHGDVMALLNRHFARHDGYVPVGGDLWHWRRLDRPAELPADTYLVRHDGAIRGCATLCRAPIVASAAGSSWVLTDLAVAAEPDAPGILGALLAPVPAGAEVLVLSAACNEAEGRLLRAAGFSVHGGEVGMVLPLAAGAERDLPSPSLWYVLTESVIGV